MVYIYRDVMQTIMPRLERRTIQIPKPLADNASTIIGKDGFSSLPDLVSTLLRNYLAQRKVNVK